MLTFNKQLFIDDAVKFTELGFITDQQQRVIANTKPDMYESATKQALFSGETFDKTLLTFIGYRELYNMLFWVTDRPQVNQNLIN